MRIGFVGAGRMGLPMVRRLVKAGHDVRVSARSEDRRRVLAESGARVRDAVAAVGAGVDAVVICVFDDAQVREVCLDSGLLTTMTAGSTLILHTTGSPATAESIAEYAAAHGVSVVDAPVSGGPHDIAAGRLTIFLGGADEVIERIQPLLNCYGNPILPVGPIGSGQRVKLINNALFAAQLRLLGESVRLASQLGLTEAALLSALPHGSAASRALSGVVARGSVEAFTRAAAEFLGKDIVAVRAVATELDADLGLLDVVIPNPNP